MSVNWTRFRNSVEMMRAEEERFGDAVAELRRITTPRPLSELTEADGSVLLWFESTCMGVARFDSANRLGRGTQWGWTPLPKVRP